MPIVTIEIYILTCIKATYKLSYIEILYLIKSISHIKEDKNHWKFDCWAFLGLAAICGRLRCNKKKITRYRDICQFI